MVNGGNILAIKLVRTNKTMNFVLYALQFGQHFPLVKSE